MLVVSRVFCNAGILLLSGLEPFGRRRERERARRAAKSVHTLHQVSRTPSMGAIDGLQLRK